MARKSSQLSSLGSRVLSSLTIMALALTAGLAQAQEPKHQALSPGAAHAAALAHLAIVQADGAVLEPNGQPVADATISFALLGTSSRIDVHTQADGRFHANLANGRYSVSVTKQGFQSQTLFPDVDSSLPSQVGHIVLLPQPGALAPPPIGHTTSHQSAAPTNAVSRSPLLVSVLVVAGVVIFLLIWRRLRPSVDRARELFEQGNLQESEAMFKSLLTSPDASAQAYYGLGLIRLKTYRFGAAIQLFKHSLSLDPTNANGYYYLGVIMEKAGSVQSARRYFLKTLAYQPNHAGALIGLQQLQAKTSRGTHQLRHAPGKEEHVEGGHKHRPVGRNRGA